MESLTVPRQTPLNQTHRDLDARMVDFSGWDMPVEYTGIIAEHLAVRNAAGLFDVSHMGEIDISGPQALDLVQWVTCNDAAKLANGQVQYSGLMTERGTFVDDIIVHRFAADHYFLCVNAGNRDKAFAHINHHNRFDATVKDVGDEYAQIALQGPCAHEILETTTPADLFALKRYWFVRTVVSGANCILARTGYTGEDGFEIYLPPEDAQHVWSGLLEKGKDVGLVPAGLGARNTLRLESGYALYGNDIDETTTPWEAGLGWICKMKKGDFLGRDMLAAQKEAGLTKLKRKLAGFEMKARGIARDGYPVYFQGEEVATVSSGSPAPHLKTNIGMAYLPLEATAPGTKIEIGVRKSRVEAEVVPLPFYRRA